MTNLRSVKNSTAGPLRQLSRVGASVVAAEPNSGERRRSEADWPAGRAGTDRVPEVQPQIRCGLGRTHVEADIDTRLASEVREASRTRNDSIRTLARMSIVADLLVVAKPPPYQEIAAEAVKLRGLGYPDRLIAECIGVTSKTVTKAIRWFENRSSVLD